MRGERSAGEEEFTDIVFVHVRVAQVSDCCNFYVIRLQRTSR